MSRKKSPLWQKILGCTVVLVLTSSAFAATPVEAQDTSVETQDTSVETQDTSVEAQDWWWEGWQKITAPFRRDSGVGIARNRGGRGAAVRDPDLCPRAQPPLTALVPNRDEPIKTSEAYPIFWFYIPYQLTPDQSTPDQLTENHDTLRFVLQDEQYEDVYETTFTVPEATAPQGIISLRLSAQDAALEVGKIYRWYFLIYCDDPERIYEPAFVEGSIQREALGADLRDEFDQRDPQSWLLARAEAGFWYDILAALAEVHWANSGDSDFVDAWEQVMQGVDLNDIDDAPIVGRYYVPPEKVPPEN